MDTSRKGSEFNNIIETWEQNERNRQKGNLSGKEEDAFNEATTATELEQVIKQEASEYDNENKENRMLSGERATINDDSNKDDNNSEGEV